MVARFAIWGILNAVKLLQVRSKVVIKGAGIMCVCVCNRRDEVLMLFVYELCKKGKKKKGNF